MLPWWALSPTVDEGAIVIPIVGAVLAGGLTWFGLRRFPRLRLAGIAFLPRWQLRDVSALLVGAAAGIALKVLAIGLSFNGGSLTLAWHHPFDLALLVQLVGLVAFAAANATWEEYTLRGFPLSALGRVLGAHGGVWATALVFSALHLMNPERSAAMLAETLLAGLLLGYAVLGGGTLLVAIGLHTGWNSTEVFFDSPRFWLSQGEASPTASMTAAGLGVLVCFVLAVRRGRLMATAGVPADDL